MKGYIELSFSGHISRCDLDSIMNVETGLPVDITNTSPARVVAKVKAGEWALSLKDCMAMGRNSDIQMLDVAEEVDS